MPLQQMHRPSQKFLSSLYFFYLWQLLPFVNTVTKKPISQIGCFGTVQTFSDVISSMIPKPSHISCSPRTTRILCLLPKVTIFGVLDFPSLSIQQFSSIILHNYSSKMIYYSLTQKNHPAHDALSNKTTCKVIGFPKTNV